MSACVLWHRAPDAAGYGRVLNEYAHRRIWRECFGEIPAGMIVHHDCEVKLCVNPEHLRLVTRAERRVRNVRAKGTTFEREIAEQFEAAGFQVRGLEAGGDHFTVARNGELMHGESKRQERLQLHIWLRQQARDCPKGMRRFLVFRRSHEPAYVVEPFAQFIERERRLADLDAA